MARRQFDVRVPHAAWNPGSVESCGWPRASGLWDTAANTYLQPGATATATQPGGAAARRRRRSSTWPSARNEPVPKIYDPGVANTIAEGGALVKADGSWWRERQQADVLASGDVCTFTREVDFGKLATRDRRRLRRPADRATSTGSSPVDFDFGQGVDYNVKCLTAQSPTSARAATSASCSPTRSTCPPSRCPRRASASCSACTGCRPTTTSSWVATRPSSSATAARARSSPRPRARGPDGSYKSYAEADVFEMWADVARHYKLNPDLTDVTRLLDGRRGHLPARQPLARPVGARVPDRRAAHVGRPRSRRSATSRCWRGTARPTSSSAPR